MFGAMGKKLGIFLRKKIGKGEFKKSWAKRNITI